MVVAVPVRDIKRLCHDIWAVQLCACVVCGRLHASRPCLSTAWLRQLHIQNKSNDTPQYINAELLHQASCGIRTHDLPLTERVLYQLS